MLMGTKKRPLQINFVLRLTFYETQVHNMPQIHSKLKNRNRSRSPNRGSRAAPNKGSDPMSTQWCYTINNYDRDTLKTLSKVHEFKKNNVAYHIFGKEVCVIYRRSASRGRRISRVILRSTHGKDVQP